MRVLLYRQSQCVISGVLLRSKSLTYVSSILRTSRLSAPMAEHFCAACKRRRSTRYHERHPLTPGTNPKPGVCSRCVRRLFPGESNEESQIVVKEIHHHYYEVHHHHFSQAGDQEAPRLDPPAFRAELSSETRHRSRVWVNNETPPPVYPGTKPTLSRVEGWQEAASRAMYREGTEHSDADSVELHGLW